MSDDKNDKNFMDEYGFNIQFGVPNVGDSYPIYGVITKFLNEDLNDVTVEINNNIEAHLSITDESRLNLLKERAFEPGIFVSTVVANDPKVVIDVSTVIFGKRPEMLEQ